MRISDWSSDVCSSDLTTHPALRFLAQFNSALIYFLLAAAVAAGVLGHLVDAGVILAVVIVNAIVGHVQEGKAERALAAIRDLIRSEEHTSELQSLMRISYAVFCLKKKKQDKL